MAKNLRKAVKRYTVKFVYAGVVQTHDFSYDTDGLLINPHIHISWWKTSDKEYPSFVKTDNIDKVLEILRKYLYRVEITHINGESVLYLEKFSKSKQTSLKSDLSKLDTLIADEISRLFGEYVLPLIKELDCVFTYSHIGKPILAKIDEEGDGEELRNLKGDEEHVIKIVISKILTAANIETNDYTDYSDIYRFLDFEKLGLKMA